MVGLAPWDARSRFQGVPPVEFNKIKADKVGLGWVTNKPRKENTNYDSNQVHKTCSPTYTHTASLVFLPFIPIQLIVTPFIFS